MFFCLSRVGKREGGGGERVREGERGREGEREGEREEKELETRTATTMTHKRSLFTSHLLFPFLSFFFENQKNS